VDKSEARLAGLLLRVATPFARLRRIPILGDLLSWTSHQLVPSDTLLWVQIQQGLAQGLWIRVNPRTGHDVQHGIGEPAVQQALQQHARTGMTFYDLGSNIGFFSLIAARLVGPSGGVVSFEADPEIAARLRENLARNNFAHAVVEQKAVWSEPTTVSFARVDSRVSPDRGLGHVSTENSSAENTIQVEAVSLDQYVALHPPPDFLKCDVEGAEVAVFQGAQQLLQKNRPILLVEMHSSKNHCSLVAKFTQLGYLCHDLDENHVLALPQ